MFLLAAAVNISDLINRRIRCVAKNIFIGNPPTVIKYNHLYFEHMAVVKISCPYKPSEDKEKVREAILNIFPNAELEDTGRGFDGTADLDMFSRLIRKQKILDSTRSVMFKGIREGKIMIHLNKQVASVGKISFAEPRAILGTLKVIIETDDPETLIDTVAPETVDGEEI